MNQTPTRPRKKPAKRGPSTVNGKMRGASRGTSGTASAEPSRSEPGLMGRASGVAQEAADTIVETMSEGVSSLTSKVSEVLDQHILGSADVLSQVASSSRLAADDMEETVPHIAGIVRTAADKLDDYSDAVRDQSLDDLIGVASNFSRRNPGLVFGLAAFAGFLLFRAVRVAPVHAQGRRAASRMH